MKKNNLLTEINYPILAFIGLVYYLIVNIGFYAIPKKNLTVVSNYFIKFVAPAQFIVLLLELILAVLVIWQWDNWFTTKQRKLILVSSGSLLLVAVIEQILSSKTLTLFDFLTFLH